MKNMNKYIMRFLRDEDAQAMVEYVLVVSIISVIAFAGVRIFTAALSRGFESLADHRAGLRGVGP